MLTHAHACNELRGFRVEAHRAGRASCSALPGAAHISSRPPAALAPGTEDRQQPQERRPPPSPRYRSTGQASFRADPAEGREEERLGSTHHIGEDLLTARRGAGQHHPLTDQLPQHRTQYHDRGNNNPTSRSAHLGGGRRGGLITAAGRGRSRAGPPGRGGTRPADCTEGGGPANGWGLGLGGS